MGTSLKELKKNRLTPTEKWLLERTEGAKPIRLSTGNVDWCDKDYKWLFEQDFENSHLVVSLFNIVLGLNIEFGLNDNEIIDLLTNILRDYTDNGKLGVIVQ